MTYNLIKLLKYTKFFFIYLIFISSSLADERIIIGVSTSVYDSGLINHINNAVKHNFNFPLYAFSKSTGQLLNYAERKDIDILIVHNKQLEQEFIKNNYGIRRYNLMYNNYIIVGPKEDPAEIKNETNLKNALKNIVNSKSFFVSRSDKSGTNLKELELWEYAGYKTINFGNWYKKIGAGMGATINFANSTKAYTLTDQATWVNHENNKNLSILFASSVFFYNQYSIIIVTPKEKNSKKFQEIKQYVKLLLSTKGRDLIDNYKVNEKQLFIFNGEIYR
tara:strand:- start:145 stop:978 length:834 start_codon:yes stop_codon:yes gene_type:complete